jgi:hypothetical protein
VTPRPILVDPKPAIALPPASEPAAAAPDLRELGQILAQEIASELRAEPKAQQSTAGAPPPVSRSRDPFLLLLALGGLLLFQRGEATATAVDEQAKAAAAQVAATNERVDTLQDAQQGEQRRAAKNENTLRELMIILAEDSRAEWDALVQIHEATRPKDGQALRQPETAQRLTGLREAMARDRETPP